LVPFKRKGIVKRGNEDTVNMPGGGMRNALRSFTMHRPEPNRQLPERVASLFEPAVGPVHARLRKKLAAKKLAAKKLADVQATAPQGKAEQAG